MTDVINQIHARKVGRPRLSPEELEKRYRARVEKAREYQATKRANPEIRALLYQRVKECKTRKAEFYKMKNIDALRAYRRRKKEAKAPNHILI